MGDINSYRRGDCRNGADTLSGALAQAENRCWAVTVYFEGCSGFMSAERGDSNCPKNQLYDPKDSHGFEMVDEQPFESLTDLVALILNLPPIGEAHVAKRPNAST